LKKINQPAGDNSAGIIDMLKDITDKLRSEFNQKLDNLLKKI
jgi:hypothetical protein